MIDQQALMQDFITAFHLEGVPKEKQEELVAKMGEAMLKRIFLDTMEKIGDAGVREYEVLLDRQAGEQEIGAFFEAKIPGYDVFVEETVKKFKSEVLEGMAA
jgi:hypothetical protein